MTSTKRLLLIGADIHPDHGVINGVNSYCRGHGNWEFHMEVMNHPDVMGRSRRAIRVWNANGIIVHATTHEMEKLVKRSGLPAVNVSGSMVSNLPAVILDDAAIGTMGARFFLENGFRNFGFSSLTVELFTQRRGEAFAAEIKRAGYRCEFFTDRCEGLKEKDWVGNRRRMDRWLQSLAKPVAVLCIYDYRAQEVALACHRLGLRVPDDVAIMGVGNAESLCRMSSPPLSSIDVNLVMLGYEAARLVHRLMEGGKRPEGAVLIPPRHVVRRHSSDMVAVEDEMVASAMRFIRDHSHEPMGVKHVVDHAATSRNTLERHFLKAIGRSPAAEIARNRMERAKSLLRETELQIPNVARGSGFTDAKAFAVSFRNRVGATPTEYRRIHQRMHF